MLNRVKSMKGRSYVERDNRSRWRSPKPCKQITARGQRFYICSRDTWRSHRRLRRGPPQSEDHLGSVLVVLVMLMILTILVRSPYDTLMPTSVCCILRYLRRCVVRVNVARVIHIISQFSALSMRLAFFVLLKQDGKCRLSAQHLETLNPSFFA